MSKTIRDRDYRRKLRTDVIKSLGGVCVSCGCDDVRALEIDHVEPLLVSRAERKQMHDARLKEWRQIRNFEYDGPKLQVLCGSCHNIKTWNETWIESTG